MNAHSTKDVFSPTTATLRRTRRAALLRTLLWAACVCVALSLVGCGAPPHPEHHAAHEEEHGEGHEEHHDDHGDHDDHNDHEDHDDHEDHSDSWSVTVWGDVYEIFPEIDALVAGAHAESHVHVTRLDGFAPLTDGTVEIVLSDSTGGEEVFSATEPVRPGIYDIEITPRQTGEFDLAFRVDSAAGRETVEGGRVRVGTADDPGGLVSDASSGTNEGTHDGTADGEPVSFSKEPQWQADFATDWVGRGAWARSLEGLAAVRPAAGGEAWVAAPVDGVVAPQPWPYPGQTVARGDILFRLAPSISSGRSLAELEADLDAAREEAGAAEARLARLEELIEVEATSPRELEDARTRAGIAAARLGSAERDLEAARAVREGRGGGAPLALEAPFDGTVASVEATPGAGAKATERLARVVRTDVVWLAVALPPHTASALSEGVSGLVLGGAAEGAAGDAGAEGADSLRFGPEETRLVSVAPGVDPQTGKLDALVEIPGSDVPLGSTWNAQVLLAAETEGVVIPTSALVDDGGQMVVFLQLGGETFLRRPVDVEARQGDRALVAGLTPGQRLVTRGGDAIRRSTLMSSGAGHGHVH